MVRSTRNSVVPVLGTVLAVAAALVSAGCSGVVTTGAPSVTVLGAEGPLELRPWTSCTSGLLGGSCSDGQPPADPPDVGTAEQVAVSLPEPGWTFDATFRPAGQPCGREQRVDLDAAPGDGTSGTIISPAGPAGTYDVDLSGRGSRGDDVNVTFRWTTPVDGPPPVPEATIAVLYEGDGQVRGYGVSLGVTDLATAPREASARVVVTSSEGASIEIDPAAEIASCSSEGSVWFSGTYEQAEEAAALGSAPFIYDVLLTLDGVEHRAAAVWPRDERSDPDESPDTPLRFTPPLPAATS